MKREGEPAPAYRNISVKLRKDSAFMDCLEKICSEIGVTTSVYARQALISKLKRDGFLTEDTRSTRQMRASIGTYRGQVGAAREKTALCPARGRKTTLAERVEMACECIERDEDYAAVSREHGVSYYQIYTWVKRYKQSGIEGLTFTRGKRQSGGRMTEAEQERARTRLQHAQQEHQRAAQAVYRQLDALENRAF